MATGGKRGGREEEKYSDRKKGGKGGWRKRGISG